MRITCRGDLTALATAVLVVFLVFQPWFVQGVVQSGIKRQVNLIVVVVVIVIVVASDWLA